MSGPDVADMPGAETDLPYVTLDLSDLPQAEL